MEVHPPEHPIHTWRDFLVHIATIVVGLLIAIGLEQTVEGLHHRHVVHVARENIREELGHNLSAAQKNAETLDAEAKNAEAALETVRRMHHDPHMHGSIQFNYSFSDLNDAAFRTARDTGAFGNMAYDEVQRYAALYGMQARISSDSLDVQTKQTELVAPLLAQEQGFEGMTQQQFEQLSGDIARTIIRLRTNAEMMRGLEQMYKTELNKQ